MPTDDYLAAIAAELNRHADSSFDLETLYIGGGTPSKLGGPGVVRLIDLLRRRADVRSNAEITLEVNPEDVTTEALRAWRAAGVNRLSLGVQSFHDSVLEWMHRTHDATTAKRAIGLAHTEGFTNVSVDLIFAMPASLNRSWARDLDVALSLEVPHLSLYGLTVERHTPLGRWVADRRAVEAPEDAFAGEFTRARQMLTSAGYDHYEVSNYGRPGHHSRHNWAYWNRRAYAGIGPSAHEFNGTMRRWNAEAYVEWMNRTARGEDPVAGTEALSPEDVLAEELYLNLRTTRGISIPDAERDHVRPWLDAGWAELTGGTLRLTGNGWLRLDSLATDLTLFRSRY